MTILIFIAVLAIIILIHEIGHFFTARRMGVGVEEFGIGFPPKLFSFKRKGIIYSINLIPVGGFVKIKGEQGDHQSDEDSFIKKKVWKRSIILSAGVIMNVVLAFILFTVAFTIGSPSIIGSESSGAIVSGKNVQIIDVSDSSPAQLAGIELGDKVLKIGENDVKTIDDFKEYVRPQVGQEISMTITRNEEEKDITVVPEADEKGGGVVGVTLAEVGLVRYPFLQAVYEGAKSTVNLLWQIIAAFYNIIKDLFSAREVAIDIAGPVGIAVLTGQVARLGIVYLLQFTALLSLNLAIINILPIPALDGGRLLFLVIEKIRRKPINRKIEGMIHNVGFIVLMLVLVVVTVKDVSKFSENIASFFKNIF